MCVCVYIYTYICTCRGLDSIGFRAYGLGIKVWGLGFSRVLDFKGSSQPLSQLLVSP